MTPRFLVDKSALARMPQVAVGERLTPIIESGEAATCAIIDLEVLYSARSHRDHQRTRRVRELAYERVPLTEEVFQRAVESLAAIPGGRVASTRLPAPPMKQSLP